MGNLDATSCAIGIIVTNKVAVYRWRRTEPTGDAAPVISNVISDNICDYKWRTIIITFNATTCAISRIIACDGMFKDILGYHEVMSIPLM